MQKPNERYRTAVLPKRSLIQRYPRLFSITFTITSLLVLFSKPIYDSCFAPQIELPDDLIVRRRRPQN